MPPRKRLDQVDAVRPMNQAGVISTHVLTFFAPAASTSCGTPGSQKGGNGSHDWPRVWQLGGRNLGQGPYATDDGMISGYRGTIRDVLTKIRATGGTVTGRFVAHQSGGAARPYLFTYVVRNGVVVSGASRVSRLRLCPEIQTAAGLRTPILRSRMITSGCNAWRTYHSFPGWVQPQPDQRIKSHVPFATLRPLTCNEACFPAPGMATSPRIRH